MKNLHKHRVELIAADRVVCHAVHLTLLGFLIVLISISSVFTFNGIVGLFDFITERLITDKGSDFWSDFLLTQHFQVLFMIPLHFGVKRFEKNRREYIYDLRKLREELFECKK